MKTLYAVVLLFLGLLGVAGAKPIDEAAARQAGAAFLQQGSRWRSTGLGPVLVLASRPAGQASPAAEPELYVFNITGTLGFVVVAGDDEVQPVLGYSGQSAFDPTNVPSNMAKWLDGYREEIRALRAHPGPAAPDVAAAWRSLQSGQGLARRGITAVAPLVQAHWNQSPYYNALCPFDNAGGGRSVSGCVATAMTQVMKFWSYPTTGAGFHSYNTTSYGTLSANFGTTTYQWAAMPNTVSSANTAVATLMYHAGVSVDMNYSANVSNAYVISAASNGVHCAEYALKTYFGYRSTMQGIQRVNYSATAWMTTLKAELDAGRPIIYAGFGTGGGHCFVADGYDTNDFLHINWGWGGQSDGYFTAGGLDPNGLGTGGGAGGYNSGQQALIGIQPPATTGPAPASMSLNNFVTPSASAVPYGQAFSVSTNLINTSTSTFTGDYAMAAFSSSGSFVDFIEVKANNSLPANFTYNNNLVFATTGLLSMLPGSYQVGVFVRPTGGNWLLVANRSSYTNLVPITITNVNAITLNSVLTVSPGLVLTRGQPAAANVNIRNNGGTTFIGQYAANLYNLDGSFAQALGVLNENNGLPPNFTYLAPFLTFPATAVTVEPGTYLLAITHRPASSANAQLTGSAGTFQNPVLVTVQAAALQADQYEVNDAVAQASVLPLTFSGGTAVRNTVGSNTHNGTDVDYYRLNLPAGYSYTITARLHDSYNSGNGQVYSQDALFSYSTDGVSWSLAYDDVMAGGPFVVNGGVPLYVKVASYFAGSTGTYLFEANLVQRVGSATTSASAGTISVFPNPAQDLLHLDLSALRSPLQQLRLRNALGQVVYSQTSTERLIPLRGLAAGVYCVEAQTSAGTLTRKVVVSK